MCGIAGILDIRNPVDQSTLIAMRDSMSHRGPDDAGIWLSETGCVGLGHRRLSIVDLSNAGHQPMLTADGTLCIVFNGEIYNHQELRLELEAKGHTFRTSSDTEVLLEAYRAWGHGCLTRLNGMFAFALYDLKKAQVFLARDRAGEKPLFYSHSATRFSFASELKGLLQDPNQPRKLEREALESYLTYGNIPGPGCILKGVHKLAPAHAACLELKDFSIKVWPYWNLPSPGTVAESLDELCDRLDPLLHDAVHRQMMADVPVGVLLSGGVDSSLVTTMAVRNAGQRVRTFTISFPGSGNYDEAPYARLVSNHFGTEHTELAAQPASVEILPELARQYDEPMCDSSMVPTYLVSKLIRQHCTVALGGDGGDELFGGYTHYSHLLSQQKIRKWTPGILRKAGAGIASHCLPIGLRGRNYLIGMPGNEGYGIARVHLFFDPVARRKLLRPLGTYDGTPPELYKENMCEHNRGLPGAAMAVDFRTYLPDDILVKVDRASMLNSLEVRAPLLDYRIIEFAFSQVPNALKANRYERKILLRKLASRILPKELDLKRKQGFSIPLHKWFQGEWGKFMQQVLREAEPSIFDQKFISTLLDGQRKGRNNT